MSVAPPQSGSLKASGLAQTGLTPRPTNPLLTKDSVGKAKPSCYELPEDQFAFGHPGDMDREGAREVSMRWVSHSRSKGPNFEPDFVHSNKQAACAKITTARDIKHFRKESDMAATPRMELGARARGISSPGGKVRDMVPSDVVPGYTYGRRIRPSTPIQEVISNRFGERSEQELTNFYSSFRELQERSKTEVRKIPFTAASRGHASRTKKAFAQQEDAKAPFKFKRFQRVGPRIQNSHRRIGAMDYGDDDEASHPLNQNAGGEATDGVGNPDETGGFEDGPEPIGTE